ncbi:transcriptional regulator, LysR family [Pseudomonas sp. NFACC02]|uniref:LysR family transcriptional regulator n=1 Tax=Pseudomonas sp. NFACC02 TaxID=1566250 RepID=UPI0008CCCE40|nr:LysR family transcriptional regulator [Pseudomonas sp. NFACC02]SEQ92894.1 transcriptional regulator, LysR family [Pseudomonas sp. NFACC02]
MSDLDLNLLLALDMLLAECSVTRAAQRLGLSSSAMSRTLTRLRAVTGDPLLVRAGRGLVPTPRAMEMRDQVHGLTRDAKAILRPQVSDVDMASVKGTFTVRASPSFMEWLSGPVVMAVTQLAPHLCLRFEARPQKDAQPLREGTVELDIGLPGTSAPEIRTRFLFRDTYVGVVRAGHPILASQKVTVQSFAAFSHVLALQEGDGIELLTRELESSGLERRITVIVPGYPDAMRIACRSELIAVVPRSCLGSERLGGSTSELISFDLPAPLPRFHISAMWHPRMDSDPVHRCLRNCIISVCQEAFPFEER